MGSENETRSLPLMHGPESRGQLEMWAGLQGAQIRVESTPTERGPLSGLGREGGEEGQEAGGRKDDIQAKEMSGPWKGTETHMTPWQEREAEGRGVTESWRIVEAAPSCSYRKARQNRPSLRRKGICCSRETC